MDCHEFEQQLEIAVENRDAAALQRLQRHAAACASSSCRQAWSDQALLTRALAAWSPAAAPPRSFAWEVARAMQSTSRRPLPVSAVNQPAVRTSAGGRGLAVMASVAAVVVLLAGLLYRGGETPRLAGQTPAPANPANLAPEAELASTATQAPRPLHPHSYVELAENATYLVTDLTLLIVPGGDDQEGLPPTAASHWATSVEASLEPVKNGVSGKLHEWFGRPAT